MTVSRQGKGLKLGRPRFFALQGHLDKIVAFFRRQRHGAGPVAGRREKDSYALKSTGETVYGDVPLRFRNLTVNEADLSELADSEAGPAGFKIRISKLARGRLQAGALVGNRYAGRGYQIPGLKKPQDLHTFIAYDEGVLVGTVGIRLDSKFGLAADELYRDEVDRLRAQGYRLCEFTRLAVDRTVASMPVIAGLFHTAYLYASLIRHATHAVIEINPRHAVFYRRSMSFEVLGPERISPRVNAPAVLLYVSFATIADGLARYAGKHGEPGAGRFYPFCFTPAEEAGVLQRLRELVRQ
jgi:hypothetical protein